MLNRLIEASQLQIGFAEFDQQIEIIGFDFGSALIKLQFAFAPIDLPEKFRCFELCLKVGWVFASLLNGRHHIACWRRTC